MLDSQHVVQVHGLKIWSLTVNHVELICHLVVTPSEENGIGVCSYVLDDVNDMLRKQYDIEECTIQIEISKKELLKYCHSCQPLKR